MHESPSSFSKHSPCHDMCSLGFLPRHKGPGSAALHEMLSNPNHRASIEAEATSPNPILRALFNHPIPSYKEAAAAHHAATPAEAAFVASKTVYKDIVCSHPELPPNKLALLTHQRSRKLKTSLWSTKNRQIMQPPQ